MRVSTLGFQTDASGQMQNLEAEISQTQTQLSTGLKVQSAADNPAGMAGEGDKGRQYYKDIVRFWHKEQGEEGRGR